MHTTNCESGVNIEKSITMKAHRFILLLALAVLPIFAGATERKSPDYYDDDLYGIHDKGAIASRKAAMEQARQESYLQRTQAANSADEFSYDFNNVVADTYESAYARRLYGFSSPTYRMPSSYYTYRYSDAFFYASAYDPALYNVMVSGDLVWVEPKYITSMFGTWGAAVVPAYSWYYNWTRPYWGWGYPYAWGGYWGFGYYDPFYAWNWWGYPYYPYYPPYPPHRPPHGPHPPHFPNGGVGNTGHYHTPGGGYGRNPGAAAPAGRNGSVSRPSAPSGRNSGVSRSNSSSYRNGGSSTYRNSGSSTYRGGGTSFGGSRGGGISHGGGTPRAGNPLGR